jgi:hypothetical protein
MKGGTPFTCGCLRILKGLLAPYAGFAPLSPVLGITFKGLFLIVVHIDLWTL